jgi:hypothetical protein
MESVLKIRDEYFGITAVSDANIPSLQLASERTSAREIIRQRVLAEVEDLNAHFLDKSKEPRRTRSFIVDVQPISPEARLNRSFRHLPNQPQLLALDVELDRAFTAFSRQRFVMLFDDKQIETLDQELVVTPDSEMIFLHLTPLRGG